MKNVKKPMINIIYTYFNNIPNIRTDDSIKISVVLIISGLFWVGNEKANAKATAPLNPDIHIIVCSLSLIFLIHLRFEHLASGNIAIAREISNPIKDLFVYIYMNEKTISYTIIKPTSI